jgi:hypothetical protein
MGQTSFGVPMILRVTPDGASVLDLGAHEMVVWGSLLEENGDHMFVFLNSIYDQMSALQKTPLPKRRPVREFMDVMAQGRRLLSQSETATGAKFGAVTMSGEQDPETESDAPGEGEEA